MLSITGIKTHYYKGTSIIQSSADIIQKSKRIMIYVQCTFDMNVHGMVCALVEESFTKHQVQKSTGKATRFKLERSVVWPTRVTRISVNSVSSSARNIIIFVWILTLFMPGKKHAHCSPWRHWLVFDGRRGLSQTVVHGARLSRIFIKILHTVVIFIQKLLYEATFWDLEPLLYWGVCQPKVVVTQGRKLILDLAGGLQNRNTLITNFKENQRNLNYRCESTHRRREAWDGHGGERSDAVGGILVRGSSNVVGRLGEVG